MLIELSGSKGSFSCNSGETLLEAGRRNGFRFRESCRNGVCYQCEAKLIEGRTWDKREQHERSCSHSGSILLCQNSPRTNCVVEIDEVYVPGEVPLKTVVCQIEKIELMPPYVYMVELLLPAGKLPTFYAGQYLALHLPGKEAPAYYSIASAPGGRTIELHIQANPESESACEVMAFLKQNPSVEISLPNGKAYLADIPSVPVVMLAAGTGFAQMKSIIEFVLRAKPDAQLSLFWGVRKQEDMYIPSLPESWENEYPNFSFHPLVADASDYDSSEHHDHLCQALIEAEPNIKEDLVFVSGSPKLVFACLDLLTAAGLPESQFFSDVLEYAQR